MSIPKISSVVAQQLPEFIRSDHATFVAFVEAYYAWMDETGNAANRSGLLLQSLDIDSTLDEFIDYFTNQFIPGIPQHLLSSKPFLIAHAKEFYRTKGTENSFKLLFRLLFNEEITISYPKDLILRVSDGKWIQQKSLRLDPTIWSIEVATGSPVFRTLNPGGNIGSINIFVDDVLQDPSTYTVSPNLPIVTFTSPPAVNAVVRIEYSAFAILALINTNAIVLSLRGEMSGATAISENGERLILPGQELFNLNVSNVKGTFQHAETITAEYTPIPGLTLRVYARLASLLDHIDVIDGGANYNVGDVIAITTGSPTAPANAVIDEIYTSLINNIRVLNGGCGYQAGLVGRITSVPNTGLDVAISTVDTSGVVHPNSYPVVTDVLSLFANTIMSNSNYGFINPGNEDANTVILNALSTITYGGSGADGLGPITNVAILMSTASFITSPTIVFDGAIAFVTGNTANGNTATANVALNYFGILGRMNVINGGTGYNVADELIFTNVPGGFGIGAAAQVIEIHTGNNGIKTVQFQPTRIAGNVSVVSGNTVEVKGYGTSFTTDLLVNNRISINTETSYVQSITNNTHLIVNTAFQRVSSNVKLGVYDRYFVGGINYRLDTLPLITISASNPSATGANVIAEGVIAGGEVFIPESGEGHSPGEIKSIRLITPGYGFIDIPTVDLTHLGNGRANALAVLVENLFTSSGYYSNQDGMLSSDRKIQGVGTFYQQHSYLIQSHIDLARYKNILKALIHPAGMQLFAEYVHDIDLGNQTIDISGTVQTRYEDGTGNLIVFDSSTSDYDGVITGFPQDGANGPIKLSSTANSFMFQFSGTASNDSIIVGDQPLLSASANQFTIEFWAAFDTLTSQLGVLQKNGRDGQGPWEYSIASVVSGTLIFEALANSAATLAYNSVTANIGDTQLHHWLWTANGSSNMVYRDAVLVKKIDGLLAGMHDTAGEFQIGVSRIPGTNLFLRMKGRLGEVAFYQKSLTHPQVITHYGSSNNVISRTNYLTRSVEIDHTDWVKDNVTITAEVTGLGSPFGANLADKLVETAANNYHRVSQATSAPSGRIILSTYVKAAERGNVSLQITDGAANNVVGHFDLNTNTTFVDQGPTGTAVSGMIPYANNWYRCYVAWDSAPANSIAFIYLNETSPGSFQYAGNTSAGLYVLGIQHEPYTANNTIPTALIATASTSNTITSYANTVLNDSPTGYWRLNDVFSSPV